MLPSIFGENLFDDWFGFPVFPELHDVDRKLYGKHAPREMKTDVREHDEGYELDIDLPGFKKDELTLRLENGYLTVSAAKGLDEEHKDKKGKVIRRERYSGAMQRSFYVGDGVEESDVHAKFEDGVLKLEIPKKDRKQIAEHHNIAIE